MEKNWFKGREKALDAALAALEAQGIGCAALNAWACAKELAGQAEEAIDDEPSIKKDNDGHWDAIDEAECEFEAALDDPRSFIRFYFEDVVLAARALVGTRHRGRSGRNPA